MNRQELQEFCLMYGIKDEKLKRAIEINEGRELSDYEDLVKEIIFEVYGGAK